MISPDEKILVRTDENDKVSLHSHNYLELAYVLSGTVIHRLNGTETTIKEGNYFIIDYDAQHGYRPIGKKNFKLVNCLFVPAFIDNTLKNCRKFSEVVNNYMIHHSYDLPNQSPANYIFSDSDGKIRPLILNLLEEYDNKQTGYLEIMRGMLIEIIVRSIRKNNEVSNASAGSIGKYIMKYTDENYTDKNILRTLSNRLNFSEPYLSRRFREDTGMIFSAYLQKVRIEESLRLLANTDKKTADIAEAVGYNDIKFFYSVFKKYVKLTPGEFKKQNRR